MRGAFLLVAGVGALVTAMLPACLDRPVTATEPHSSNLFVAPTENHAIDKLDLLFMIDNSNSMGDKQTLLAQAVPELVNRLVVPRCVSKGGQSAVRASLDEPCPAGLQPEFRAVRDIHVAVVTSSLGAHGASGQVCAGSQNDDHARLLPSVRSGLSSYQGSGFLAWDPERKLSPPGEVDAGQLGKQFGEMVKAAGEQGCGYESSLESWYRFLVDPEPPLSVSVQDGQSAAQGVDLDVLAQRKAFLRPDSLVAIVMLTDENDCSIRDDGLGYRTASGAAMPRATAACAKDPNDPCCLPCTLKGTLPAGCPPLAEDPSCKLSASLPELEDSHNLRCWDAKRRFGIDLLYPTSRYIDALTKTEVVKRSTGELVRNPLFDAPPGMFSRDPKLIYLAGIVGVPWQDIADDASLKGPGLRYLTATELTERKRWDVLVGDRERNIPPADPFMQESVEPRLGSNPITGDAIVPPTAMNPTASPINGHEQNPPKEGGDDLQYACTFPLPATASCDDNTCDCSTTDNALAERNRPLCQPPSGGNASTTQHFGKAYPGLRTLEVLRGIGESAIVASICPKVIEPNRPGYGYQPAVDALVDRLKGVFSAQCLPRLLAVQPDAGGQLPCVVVEAAPPTSACSCDAQRRHAPTPEAAKLVREQLKQRSNCGTSTTPSCDDFCLCELEQAEGDSLDKCLNSEVEDASTPGYCYVHPYGPDPQGNPALVEGCDASSRQLIRFVGPETPKPGATTFIACLGATTR